MVSTEDYVVEGPRFKSCSGQNLFRDKMVRFDLGKSIKWLTPNMEQHREKITLFENIFYAPSLGLFLKPDRGRPEKISQGCFSICRCMSGFIFFLIDCLEKPKNYFHFTVVCLFISHCFFLWFTSFTI